MSVFVRNLLVAAAIIALCAAAGAQTKRRKSGASAKAPVPAATPAAEPTPVPEPTPVTAKRNERPGFVSPAVNGNAQPAVQNGPAYIYQFSRPGFTISKIRIEHDDSGKGTITFDHKDSDESITDPISLSPATLENLRNAFTALDFLNSAEIYQHERDYSHLGNVTVTLRQGGRERTAAFNYTENKFAKAIGDEYRRIANQYTWMFDINIARENRPLEAPSLLGVMDGYLRRKEISDPPQLVPFLQQLSNDERLPLIARNHAARLIKQIEKEKK